MDPPIHQAINQFINPSPTVGEPTKPAEPTEFTEPTEPTKPTEFTEPTELTVGLEDWGAGVGAGGAAGAVAAAGAAAGAAGHVGAGALPRGARDEHRVADAERGRACPAGAAAPVASGSV